ncbi:MAG TPA: hypothetical protein VLM38_01125, partial [Blastocatellia bacterium]|nr:hypothetical protein [Blastocatellia bacterium]
MSRITVVVPHDGDATSSALAESFASSPAVEEVALISRTDFDLSHFSARLKDKAGVVKGDFFSGAVVNRVVDEAASEYLLVVFPGERVDLGQRALERLISASENSGAGLIYSD